MTYSYQMQRVFDLTIRKEFAKFEINFNSQLIKIDNRSGNDFNDYEEKVDNENTRIPIN